MNVKHRYTRTLAVVLAVSLLFQLTSCGTLMYPERQDQGTGKIDPTVAILDGIGLLLFIIPGLIAFAVDFHTDAIYLPAGDGASNSDKEAWLEGPVKVVHLPPGQLDIKAIEKVLSQELGKTIRLENEDVQAFAFNTAEELAEQVARINSDIARRQVLASAVK